MPQPLVIESSKHNPEIVFNKEENIFKISGRSIVEDPNKFYMPVYEWLEAYTADPNPETEFKFDLEYFNSSSARQVMKLIMLLEKLHLNGKNVKVIWLFEQGDEMAQERGMEIKAVSKLPFEIVEYESDDLDL
jgi:hypothetical protein